MPAAKSSSINTGAKSPSTERPSSRVAQPKEQTLAHQTSGRWKYNLRDLVDEDGWVYIKIRKGMYGLPQAGIIAKNQLLEKRLSEKGCYQCQHTRGLWRHVWCSIVFCLAVDDLE